ncbi:MAG: Asp-tRNA(Asn)/Glu-tRNA(Gln) amidotransferase subunit GatB [Patescibacteria group bacterium]|nr:Asp-tRNA(Asn)/Glu-tRNA(Gln) amidotransferase subunit GatB [Patescibacteria group bacterium]
MKENFKTTIGLEIHIELKTKTKMFCDCKNADAKTPNQYVCPICLGHPGTLPVPNKLAIKYAIMLGLALDCEIPQESKFDRKHYFYPDLPKNYQISQYDMPFAIAGSLKIKDQNSKIKTIRITRVHLEEDAGKLIHPDGASYSLVDYNRGGVPLIETVTEPDLESPAQAKTFLQDLRLIVRYLGISDADMEKGHLRCDANISVQRGVETTPIFEIKNMNSFRAVERALAYEAERLRNNFEELKTQIGKRTLTWVGTQNKTQEMRSKEEAADYRYFPEPDIPMFYPHKMFDLKKIQKELPEMPEARLTILKTKYNLSDNEAFALLVRPKWYNYFQKVCLNVSPKIVADFMVNENLGVSLDVKDLKKLVLFLVKKKTTRSFIKQVVLPGLKKGKKIDDLLKLTDSTIDLDKIVQKIVRENKGAVNNYQKGKDSALQFLVGQVMRDTRGQAQAEEVAKKLKKILK